MQENYQVNLGSTNKKQSTSPAFDVTPIVALLLNAYDRVPLAGGINLYLDSLARKGGCQSTVTYLLGGDKEPGSSGTPFETSLNFLRALSNSKTNPFRS